MEGRGEDCDVGCTSAQGHGRRYGGRAGRQADRQAGRQTDTDRRNTGVDDGEGVGPGRGRPRNQDDNRRVGAVMHDAQIRAITPITVQIIVRGSVAGNARRLRRNTTERHARLVHPRTTRFRVRVDIGGRSAGRGLGERRHDFGLEIAGASGAVAATLPKRAYDLPTAF